MAMVDRGKYFVRAEVSKKQKEYIGVLADLRGVPAQELLGQVVERFIDSNLQLIQDYKKELDESNKKAKSAIKMDI